MVLDFNFLHSNHPSATYISNLSENLLRPKVKWDPAAHINLLEAGRQQPIVWLHRSTLIFLVLYPLASTKFVMPYSCLGTQTRTYSCPYHKYCPQRQLSKRWKFISLFRFGDVIFWLLVKFSDATLVKKALFSFPPDAFVCLCNTDTTTYPVSCNPTTRVWGTYLIHMSPLFVETRLPENVWLSFNLARSFSKSVTFDAVWLCNFQLVVAFNEPFNVERLFHSSPI